MRFKTNARLLAKVTSVEWRLLLNERSLIILAPMILLTLLIFSLGAKGPYGVRLVMDSGMLAQQNVGLLSIILMGITIFFIGEGLAKEKELQFREIILSTPIPTPVFLLGKVLAIVGLVCLILFLSLIVSLLAQYAFFKTRLELKPHLVLYFFVLLPSVIYLSSFSLALHVLCRNKYLASTLIVLYIATLVYLFSVGERNWLINFPAFLLYKYSDLVGLAPYRSGLLLSRLFYLSLSLALFGLACFFFDRSQERLRSYFTRGRLFKTKAVLLTLLISIGLSIILAARTSAEMEKGWQSNKWKSFWETYASVNKEAYQSYRGVTISHENIRLDLFPERSSLELQAEFFVKNNDHQPVDQVLITLNPDLQLQNLSVNGKQPRLENRAGLLVVTPDHPVQPQEEINIKVGYAGRVPPGLMKSSYALYALIEPGGTFLASMAQQGFAWLPYFGYFSFHDVQRKTSTRGDQRAVEEEEVFHEPEINPGFRLPPPFTLRFAVSVPKDEVAISCGDLREMESHEARKTFVWETNNPIPYFPLLSGKFERKSRGRCEVWYHPHHGRNVDRMLDIADASLQFYSRIYPPYPFGRLRIVEYPRVATFAQTFPGVTALSEDMGFAYVMSDEGLNPLYWLLCHEVAHQWWGSAVTPVNVGSGLLTEGLANFSTLLAIEHILGEPKMRLRLKQMEDSYLRRRAVELERPLIDAYVSKTRDLPVIYDKGGYVLFMLMNQMGKEKMLAALRAYFTKYRLAATMPTISDFLQVMKASAPELDWFYNQWFYQVVLPQYKIDQAAVTKRAGLYQTTFEIENIGTGAMPVTVEVQGRSQRQDSFLSQRTVLWIGSKTKATTSITTAFEPRELIVDPDKEILQLERDNARVKLEPSRTQ